jgi:hypothetical protein
MGLLERVLEEEKKQKSQGLLKRANYIRTLTGPADSSQPSFDTGPEDEKKNSPIREDLQEKPYPIRKRE